jgi:hypothetical protein
MDSLYYDADYAIVICTLCKYALHQGKSVIAEHLSAHHKELFATPKEMRAYAKTFASYRQSRPEIVHMIHVPPDKAPHPHLELHSNGVACRLCDSEPKILCTRKGMQTHLKVAHQWLQDQQPGRPRQRPRDNRQGGLFEEVTRPVYCQTFHKKGQHSRYFEVRMPIVSCEDATPFAQLSLREKVEQDLARKLQSVNRSQNSVVTQAHSVDVSPWLDMTRWPQYLRGHDLAALAPLVHLPPRQVDPQGAEAHHAMLQQHLIGSFDRLIELARESILTEKVNVFDQHRINSFIRRKSSDRPLFCKLQEGTYKKYKAVWQRLLCYIYRLVVQRKYPALAYVFTDSQSAGLDRMLAAVRALEAYREEARPPRDQRYDEGLQECKKRLDQACLLFCISLLDHCLRGNIYDSIVIGFLAVLGINEKENRFYEAVQYTSHLSAFMKMAQMLVIQRAVLAADYGEVEYPADILDVMRDRFMIYGSSSPMNWALKLRAYGKKIRDSTTSLGYIIWSEDGTGLSYKDTEL